MSSPFRIVCWNPGDPESFGDLNVVLSKDVSEAREWGQLGTLSGGQWFQARNCEPPELGTFAWLLKYKYAANTTTVMNGVPGETNAFFRTMDQLLAALGRWDLGGYIAARRVVSSLSAPGNLTKLAIVLDVLDRFAANVVATTTSGSWCDVSRHDWFPGTSGLVALLEQTEGFLSGLSSDLSPLVAPILAAVKRVKAELTKWASCAAEMLVYRASCYCYALAEHAVASQRALSGLMFTHRAVDLYLLSLCLKTSRARLEKSGPRYSGTSDDVRLTNSYVHLEQDGTVGRNPARSTWIRELNGARNNLLYAHGTSAIYGSSVSTHIAKAADLARSVDGHEKWKLDAQSLFAAVVLSPAVLFAVETGIETYLEPFDPQTTV